MGQGRRAFGTVNRIVDKVHDVGFAALNSAPKDKSGIASAVNNGLASAGPLIVIALLGVAGIDHAYVLGVTLCAGLALAAGAISLAFVRKVAANDQRRHNDPANDQ